MSGRGGLPAYANLEWRLDVEVARRRRHNVAEPTRGPARTSGRADAAGRPRRGAPLARGWFFPHCGRPAVAPAETVPAATIQTK